MCFPSVSATCQSLSQRACLCQTVTIVSLSLSPALQWLIALYVYYIYIFLHRIKKFPSLLMCRATLPWSLFLEMFFSVPLPSENSGSVSSARSLDNLCFFYQDVVGVSVTAGAVAISTAQAQVSKTQCLKQTPDRQTEALCGSPKRTAFTRIISTQGGGSSDTLPDVGLLNACFIHEPDSEGPSGRGFAPIRWLNVWDSPHWTSVPGTAPQVCVLPWPPQHRAPGEPPVCPPWVLGTRLAMRQTHRPTTEPHRLQQGTRGIAA